MSVQHSPYWVFGVEQLERALESHVRAMPELQPKVSNLVTDAAGVVALIREFLSGPAALVHGLRIEPAPFTKPEAKP